MLVLFSISSSEINFGINLFCRMSFRQIKVFLNLKCWPGDTIPAVYTYTVSLTTYYISAIKHPLKFYVNHILINNKFIYVYKVNQVYIRLKIKPNSVKIRFESCQCFVFPSMGFEHTPLIHCSTIR